MCTDMPLWSGLLPWAGRSSDAIRSFYAHGCTSQPEMGAKQAVTGGLLATVLACVLNHEV